MTAKPIIVRDERGRAIVQSLISGLNIARPWSVEIKPYVKRRTLSQNALMWKWVDEAVKIIHETTGVDKDQLHEALKRKFLEPKRFEILGEQVAVYSTKDLKTAEMSAYMNKIEAWAATELGLVLPHPGDLGR